MVCLPEIQLDIKPLSLGFAKLLEVGEGLASVKFRLPDAEHVQVGAIENIDDGLLHFYVSIRD
jgi:hypothetical protein